MVVSEIILFALKFWAKMGSLRTVSSTSLLVRSSETRTHYNLGFPWIYRLPESRTSDVDWHQMNDEPISPIIPVDFPWKRKYQPHSEKLRDLQNFFFWFRSLFLNSCPSDKIYLLSCFSSRIKLAISCRAEFFFISCFVEEFLHWFLQVVSVSGTMCCWPFCVCSVILVLLLAGCFSLRNYVVLAFYVY